MRRTESATSGLVVIHAVLWAAVSGCAAFGDAPSERRRVHFLASPQFDGEVFGNKLPRTVTPFLTVLGRMLESWPGQVPEAPVPLQRPQHLGGETSRELRLTWLGHSTFFVELEGVRILVDPVFGERCSPFPFLGPKRFHPPPLSLDELGRIDLVIISHDHYDHLEEATIRRLKSKTARFAVPLGVGAHLVSWGIPSQSIREFDWWDSSRIGPIEIVATPSRHFSGRSFQDENTTLWAGWILRTRNHSLYYSGDTAMFPGFKEIGRRYGPFDVTLLEVGAYSQDWVDVHLGPEQAVEAHLAVGGGVLIPVHWGTFPLAYHSWVEPMERLWAAATKAGVPFVTPIPGQVFDVKAMPPPTRWWPSDVPWESAEVRPMRSTGLDADEGAAQTPEPGAGSAQRSGPEKKR